MSKNINQKDFTVLAQEVFHQALRDINEVIQRDNILTMPNDVSCDSFLRYLNDNHSRMSLGVSLEQLTMSIYKKAVDDIAFQSDEHRFFLREIPMRTQLKSCEQSLSNVQQHQVSFAQMATN